MRPMALLDGKVCVISGGAGSVGLATAKACFAEGASIALFDLRQGDLDRAATELGGGDRVTTRVVDVADAEQVRAGFEAVAKLWGKIDAIVSNAGNQGFIGPLADYSEADFDKTLTIHARGAFLACKYGPRHMSRGGSIVITSSIAGVRGGNGTNIGYVAAKHAQIGVMRAASRALAPSGIRVNTINPGAIDNEFQTSIERAQGKVLGTDVTAQLNQTIPLKRHAKPEEIAGTILFVVSDLSSYVTGAVMMADGGLMS
jgi:NAD(P)-dependent dehydrogenase (short-subunit alcohol dehydrogenase family)